MEISSLRNKLIGELVIGAGKEDLSLYVNILSIKMEEEEGLDLSYSVRAAIASFNESEKIHALAFVKQILARHSEYGNYLAEKLSFEDLTIQGDRRTISDWIYNLRRVYNPSIKLLDGKAVIWGLCLLDQHLGRYFKSRDPEREFILTLEKDISKDHEGKPFDSFLTDFGKTLLKSLDEKPKREMPKETESVPWHSDSPSQIDRLDRQYYAKALAIRLERIYRYAEPFFLHIHGSWGSGKSTILNLIEKELVQDQAEDDKRHNRKRIRLRCRNWVVVRFNAWQQQGAGPAWWTLTDAVYIQSKKQLCLLHFLKLKLFENTWRLSHGFSHRFFWPAIILGIVVVILFSLDASSMKEATQTVDKFLEYLQNRLGLVIASCVAIMTGILALSKSLAPGSSQAASEFVNLTNNPMDKISRHYYRLVKWIRKPIAVFIDDLDRCRETYVIDLLERIQTLFRDSNVIYLIAADRRWIYTCYEKNYDAFKENLKQPGRPLHFLFLEKVFQLSVPVPTLNSELRQRYWEFLLKKITPEEDKILQKELQIALRKKQEEFRQYDTDAEVIKASTATTGNLIEDITNRGAALIRLASSEVESDIENKLRPFAQFMDPNPRFMKRVMNLYGIARSIEIYSAEGKEELKEFGKWIRWIIICLKWPRLSEYLQQKPNMIEYFNGDHNFSHNRREVDQLAIDDDLQKISSDDLIRDILLHDWNHTRKPLDEADIKYFSAMTI